MDACGQNVRYEHVPYAVVGIEPGADECRVLNHRAEHQEEQVEGDVQSYKQQFERSKSDRSPLVTQVRKRYARERIHSHHYRQQRNKLLVSRIPHGSSDRTLEQHAQNGKEGRGGEQRRPCGSIDLLRVVALAVSETEEPRLHAVGQDHQQQRRPRVQVRDDAVVRRLLQHICVQRHKEPVQELAHNATDAVYGSVFGQRTHLTHRRVLLYK